VKVFIKYLSHFKFDDVVLKKNYVKSPAQLSEKCDIQDICSNRMDLISGFGDVDRFKKDVK
jgi:hypothetical protein